MNKVPPRREFPEHAELPPKELKVECWICYDAYRQRKAAKR